MNFTKEELEIIDKLLSYTSIEYGLTKEEQELWAKINNLLDNH